MNTRFRGAEWQMLLNTIPIPAALVDRYGRPVQENEMMTRAGSLEWSDAEGSLAEHQRRAVRAGKAVLFEGDRYLWAIVPAFDRQSCLLIGFESGAGSTTPSANGDARILRRVRAQLGAIAGLAGSLEKSLNGSGREQAAMIERNSRLVLHEILTLEHPNSG